MINVFRHATKAEIHGILRKNVYLHAVTSFERKSRHRYDTYAVSYRVCRIVTVYNRIKPIHVLRMRQKCCVCVCKGNDTVGTNNVCEALSLSLSLSLSL